VRNGKSGDRANNRTSRKSFRAIFIGSVSGVHARAFVSESPRWRKRNSSIPNVRIAKCERT
jgi:hypothetical protein